MIQSYDQIKKQSILINNQVQENVYIQKIYSTSQFICCSFRFVGKTQYVYIGRGAGKEGLWIDDEKPESFLRKKDKLLEYLRKHLGSTSFNSFVIDEQDRIFSINYNKWGRINRFYFFYNGRNLYFANHFYDVKASQMKLFRSWTNKVELANESNFALFDEVGRKKLDHSELASKDNISIKKMLNEEKKKALKSSVGVKSQKFLSRKRSKILGDLDNINSIEALRDLAQKSENLSQLPLKHTVEKIVLKFKEKDHYKRRDEVYTKIKKLNKAKGILDIRLKDTEALLEKNNKINLINTLKVTSPIWKIKKEKIIEIKSIDKKYKVLTFDSLSMAIGLSAHGNDQMRKEWSKKDDYWFHLDGDKSSHIIIKIKDGILSEKNFIIAGSALIEFGGLNYTEANILYTQVKNLKGVKGVPGKVTYKKEKRISIHIDPSWRDLLF
ncbi:MAG: hypothetical protein HON90_16895 [Halobacteriovoraceae bacterium]|jgi:predicted ribosome quality control (RQC) complex YloA/Tae2 family protein|nr:hypothetical protein [Halobacteriovoraceae bacterium]